MSAVPNPYASSNLYDGCDDSRLEADREALEKKCRDFAASLAEDVDALMDKMERVFRRDARGDDEELAEVEAGFHDHRDENKRAFVNALMRTAIR